MKNKHIRPMQSGAGASERDCPVFRGARAQAPRSIIYGLRISLPTSACLPTRRAYRALAEELITHPFRAAFAGDARKRGKAPAVRARAPLSMRDNAVLTVPTCRWAKTVSLDYANLEILEMYLFYWVIQLVIRGSLEKFLWFRK